MTSIDGVRRIVGLIVNPVAGMGGSVGLKGTDGAMYQRALALGARPAAAARARECLEHITNIDQLRLLSAPGAMGADCLAEVGLDATVVGEIGAESSAADTRRITGELLAAGAELLIFVGGDGTARDICDVVPEGSPVVAVPAGVKVYSAAFAVSPRAAAEMVDAWLAGAALGEEDVLDIDEEAFRAGRLDSRLYGALTVPQVVKLIQGGKEASGGISEQAAKAEVASYLAESLQPDALYLLGPGTTVKAVADALGLAKTLLGVDAVCNRELVGRDLNERGILELLQAHPAAYIVVTPLGGNGFIFGRGNKQFTPAVIRRVGVDRVVIVSTREKLRALDCLRVDSGDTRLDAELAGYRSVWVGYRYSTMVRVDC